MGRCLVRLREDASSHARRRDESRRGCGEELERRERASRLRRTHKNRFDSALASLRSGRRGAVPAAAGPSLRFRPRIKRAPTVVGVIPWTRSQGRSDIDSYTVPAPRFGPETPYRPRPRRLHKRTETLNIQAQQQDAFVSWAGPYGFRYPHGQEQSHRHVEANPVLSRAFYRAYDIRDPTFET